MKKVSIKRYLFLVVGIVFLVYIWLRGSLDKLYLDTDIARDLSEISKLWIGQSVIWLGPRFSMGLHSSPLYYYLFYIPVYLSGGNAHSIIVFNILLATSALLFLGYLSIKKYGFTAILVPLFLGLMPWWREIAIHPGNGFTYAIFLLGFLTTLWFDLPIYISSLLLGISLSMHPSATFGLPLLLYELVKRKTFAKKWLLSIIAFALPFAPLIAFEFVTKGYWLKEWLAQPDYGVNMNFGIVNLLGFFKVSGVNVVLGLVLLVFAFYISKKREKVWLGLGIVGLFILQLFNAFPRHYLFGLTAIICFVAALIFVKRSLGKIILILLILYFAVSIAISPKPTISQRSISKIEGVVEQLIDSGEIKKSESLAVVSLRTADTRTPQADDYRYFLRVRGFKVEEVSDYKNADKLIVFVEKKDLDWENWNSWETGQFGKEGEPEIIDSGDILIAVYFKEKW